MLQHPNEYLSSFVPRTIAEWACDNLVDGHKSIIDKSNPLLQYAKMMQVATPFQCKYGSLLEAMVFSKYQNMNLVIYEQISGISQ